MRYWGYFAAKIVGAAGILSGLLALINWFIPAKPDYFYEKPPRFGYDLTYTDVRGRFVYLTATYSFK